MGVLQSLAKLREQGRQAGPGQGPPTLLRPQRPQVRAVHVFHGNEGVLVLGFVEFVNPDDIRMGQLLAAGRFPAQRIQDGRVKANFGRKELESDFSLEELVEGQPHHPHPPLAQHAAQGVTSSGDFYGGGILRVRCPGFVHVQRNCFLHHTRSIGRTTLLPKRALSPGGTKEHSPPIHR